MGHIQIEDRDGIALVRIDRPPVNAMNLDLLAEGIEVAGSLEADAPKAVVLAGRQGCFSAGLDLKMVATLDPSRADELVAGVNNLFTSWYRLPLPVACAVDGHAIAGGFILALCADYRVGGRSGKIGLTELTAGVPYPEMAMRVVKAELTPAVARRLVLGSKLHDLDTGVEMGFLDELADDPLARALEVASELAEPLFGEVKLHLRREALHNPA